MYNHCSEAARPGGLSVTPEQWWRALLTMAYMCGWRLGELLSLRWDDVDLETGTAITRAANNKGKRDETVRLHPIVIEHLEPLRSFDSLVFSWDRHRRALYFDLERIQTAAGIHLPCPDAGTERHGDCTPACHLYSFHDERRAFATNNEGRVSPETLQKLMRHRSYATTQGYIQMARKLNPAVDDLHVPAIPRVAGKIG